MATKTTAPRKRKTVSRLQGLAGGTESPTTAEIDGNVGGIVGGLVAAVEAAGHRSRELSVDSLFPHPFNDPRRSEPAPGDYKWEELLRSVKAQGVQLPGSAVTRAAFVAARPGVAIPEDMTHVLIFGHRRRIAAKTAGRPTMPVVVDDSILENGGDLDVMAMENLGREDLKPLAEAELFARFSEEFGLNQSAIADRLGVDQATVSRRLALLLVTPEVTEALDSNHITASAAAALAGALPWGPHRRWQKSKSDDQDSEQRRVEQNAALKLILDTAATPTRAAERIIAERSARDEAQRRGIQIVDDIGSLLGPQYLDRLIDDPDTVEAAVATIDPSTGALLYYSTSTSTAPEPIGPAVNPTSNTNGAGTTVDDAPPWKQDDDENHETDTQSQHAASDRQPTPTEPQESTPAAGGEVIVDDRQGNDETVDARQNQDAVAAAAARERRLAAAATTADGVPSKAQLAELLVAAIVDGIELNARQVVAQAARWGSDATGVRDYKADAATAWRRLVAGYEDSVDRKGRWADVGQTYLDLLNDRAGYVPAAWERQQLV